MGNENQHIYKRPVDEYLPCEQYKVGNGFVKFFREDDKRFYFSFNNSGTTYLRSQGYQNEPGRDNGIDSIIRNSPLDERWFDGYDEEEKYYYYGLKAGNRQEIARSCRFDNKEEMEKSIAWVRGEESTLGKGAQEREGLWWSAAALRRKQEEEAAAQKTAPVSEVDLIPKLEPIVVPAAVVEKVSPIADAEVSEKGGCSKWLWWLLPVILLAILCYFFCRGCDDKIIETPADISKVVETVEEANKTISKIADKLESAITSGDSFVLEGLNFVYNKDILTEESKVILAEVVAILKKHPDVKVVVEGHTDDKGNDSFNKALSSRRAEFIKSSMVKSGISSSRLKAIGFGERHPIATNGTEEGRAKNRRIEFKIIK